MSIQPHSYRQQIFQILDDVGPDRFTPLQLAQKVGCRKPTAARYCCEWKQESVEAPAPDTEQCTYCDLYGWDHNPIYSGICLWCWANLAGLDLGHLVSQIGWKGVITMLKTGERRCTYCEEPALTPGFIKPPMCREHYELALLISRLERHGLPVTVDNLRTFLTRHCLRFAITTDDIPGLLQDMQNGQGSLSALEGE